jgi:dTDP-4-amino-4,6-dideoxygalactose transaminase
VVPPEPSSPRIRDLAISGGTRVRAAPWPTYEYGTGPFSEDAQRDIARVLASGRLFRYDARPVGETEAEKLERALCDYFGTSYALAVTSGTAALTVALLALDIPSGSTVACPAFGFPATASAILLAGLKPALVAVDENLHIDVGDLASRYGDTLGAVVVVHMRGFAAPVTDVLRCAAGWSVPLVEDAVPALGVSYAGRRLGTFGEAGCFSTQSDKAINTGEGGFLITDDALLHERAVLFSGAFEGRHRFHLHKLEESNQWRLPLYNFRIDEMRAALAHSQLCTLDARMGTLKENYTYVTSRISSIPGLRVRQPTVPEAYLGDALVFFVEPEHAEWIAEALTAEGVTARNFGAGRDPNARAFWTWEFMGGHDAAGTEPFRESVVHLRSAIDVALPAVLTQDDLDDCVTAIEKVMAAVPV